MAASSKSGSRKGDTYFGSSTSSDNEGEMTDKQLVCFRQKV
tara:strand:- start:332 stop:454 length:123 start_codon:yes stop_codon:yes gene_type:complete